MNSIRKKISVGGTLVIALSLFFAVSGLAQQVQVLNPLYVQARGLWGQLSNAPLRNDIKASYGKRFGDLAREQQQLWVLAGQVDNGSCTDGCAASYSGRVLAWQEALKRFNCDAYMALVPSNNSPGVPPTSGGLPPNSPGGGAIMRACPIGAQGIGHR